jgi:hypothetical protein
MCPGILFKWDVVNTTMNFWNPKNKDCCDIYQRFYGTLNSWIFVYFQENGAAFEAGGLEVGQLILEVDGQKVEGKDFVERRYYTMEGIKAVGESVPSVHLSGSTTIKLWLIINVILVM